jgi:hypothetical protein
VRRNAWCARGGIDEGVVVLDIGGDGNGGIEGDACEEGVVGLPYLDEVVGLCGGLVVFGATCVAAAGAGVVGAVVVQADEYGVVVEDF